MQRRFPEYKLTFGTNAPLKSYLEITVIFNEKKNKKCPKFTFLFEIIFYVHFLDLYFQCLRKNLRF
jgi:hypothetical protein